LAQPILNEIVDKIGETASLAMKKGNDAIFVCKKDSPQPLSLRLGLFERVPLYATAVGKVILAHLPKEELKKYLSSVERIPLTKFTITNPRIFERELQSIRAKGIAYSREEQFEDLFAVAVPVFDLRNRSLQG
jgi:DNA-binding IclR family transcriptional regulator